MKRRIEVCMAIGVNVRVLVDAESKREAKAYARRLKVGEVTMYDPEDPAAPVSDAEVEFDETYEEIVGGVIDHADLGKEARKKANKARKAAER